LLTGLVLVGLFTAGALFGAGLMRWTDRGPPHGPPPPRGPVEAMTHELELDDAQIDRLHRIADDHRDELERIGREVQPRIKTVLFAIEDELRPMLRPDQVERLEAWRKRRPPARLP
jgi:hypothetical protein